MEVALECKYCGHCWTLSYYAVSMKNALKCPACRDKDIKVKKVNKVDYYKDEVQEDDAYLKKEDDND